MKKYMNLHGTSGVIFYEIDSDAISVVFSDMSIYRYTYRSAGRSKVEEMKKCAERGYGLNSYINRHAKLLYESKSRY